MKQKQNSLQTNSEINEKNILNVDKTKEIETFNTNIMDKTEPREFVLRNNHLKPKIFKATILNPINNEMVEKFNYLIIQDKLIISLQDFIPEEKFPDYQFFDFSDKIIIPGLIDTHIHLAQYPNIGVGGNLELLEWLKKYTFPTEKAFKDKNFAERIAEHFFDELIQNGTTASSIFTTIHHEANDVIFDVARGKEVRANIGKVLMNINSPKYLSEKTEKAILSAKWLINNWDGKNDGKLHFVVTPRFAPSCSKELLLAAGNLAKDYNLRIQTHLSENKNEIDFVRKLYPEYENYTDIYAKTGLLRDNTILAHSIHLDDDEIQTIKKLNCGIAHCPCSNNYLSSGIMPYIKYKKQGLKIGLGSDISGGYQMSLFVQMRISIEASKYAKLYLNQESIASPTDAFYMATLGGAKVLDLDKITGSLEKGKEADFLVLNNPYSNYSIKRKIKTDELLSKLIYCSKPTDINSVWIQGKQIK